MSDDTQELKPMTEITRDVLVQWRATSLFNCPARADEPVVLEPAVPSEIAQLRVICREQAALISRLKADVDAKAAEIERLRVFEPKGGMPARALTVGTVRRG